jgi:mono/diheme cytochrome c family protein
MTPLRRFALALLAFTVNVYAAGEWNPATNYPSLKPADAIRTIEVPRGHRLVCIASEPMVEEPAAMAFDGNGALYVCEWRTYMQDEHGTGQLDPVSRVVKLVDTDGDGVMDKRTVFIDNVILPRSVLPLHDRVLVHFTQDSTIWAYFDDNKDGVSDRREVAWKGTLDNGNIEHQQSGLLWNLDNTICSNDRRLRWENGKLHEMRHEVGRVSQWGLARDDDGRLVCSWGGGANPAHSFQLPAGYPIVPMNEHDPDYERTWGLCPVWDESDGGYDVQRRVVTTRFTASCGQTVLRSSLMPNWYGNAVTCEPVGRLIRMSRFEWKEGAGVAFNAFPGGEFIRSSDAYFRPVWTENGPDGGLYIADMYRGIIQEKEWFPTAVTPELRKRYVEDYRKNKMELWVERYERIKRWGMLKVFRHGRIYRLLPEDAKPAAAPKMLDETPEQLVAHLAHPGGWWRDTAQALIVSRGDKSAVPALTKMAAAHESPNARVHALWTLEGLNALTRESILAALKHPHARVRRAAVQLTEPHLLQRDADVASALAAMTDDTDAQVATQVFLAYRAAGQLPLSFVSLARPLPVVSKIIERDQKSQLQRLSDTARKGKLVYENLCIACHGPDGQGVATTDKLLAPPLTKSMWFAEGGHVPALARILLKGQTGPIDGVNYGEGVMVPLQNTHSDDELAQVVSYIGEGWHGWSKPAEAREIADVRKSIADREQPWTHEELIAWQQARAKDFHPIPFGAAATADGRKGLYLAADVAGDRVPLRKYGGVQINGVPFSLPDPAGLKSGANLIVLKGGNTPNTISQTMPQSVDLPVNRPAGRLHLLGAVAGWGWPATRTKEPALEITVHYQGGASEKIELINGIDIADHAGPNEVPGSVRTSLVHKGQMRYLWRNLGQPGRIVERITLSSFSKSFAPMVAAMTMESPGGENRLAPPPLSGGPSRPTDEARTQ